MRFSGHSQQPLVLLVRFLEHSRQLGNMVLHRPLAFLVSPFAFLSPLELFT
jgi:hypothetical protein